MFGHVGQRVEGFLRRGEDAATVDAPAGRGVEQAELDGQPVQPRQVDALLFRGLETELAVGVGEFGEPGIGQQRAVAEDLVEDVRFLQVVQLLGLADEGGDGKLLAGQQLEEGLERDQRRHSRHAPASGGFEHTIDLAELRNALQRQAELFDTVQILLAGAVLDPLQLASDQGVPHLMFAFRVMDKATLVRFPGQVLRTLHRYLLLGAVVLVLTRACR